MFSNHLIRPALALALGAVVAALAGPTLAFGGAGSNTTLLDHWNNYATSRPFDGRSADTLEAMSAAQTPTIADGRSADTLDAVYAAQTATIADGRSADTLDAVYDARSEPVILDGRSPDTREAAEFPRPVTFVAPGGFDWLEPGIVAGFATGLALVAGALLMWIRRHDRRIQAT